VQRIVRSTCACDVSPVVKEVYGARTWSERVGLDVVEDRTAVELPILCARVLGSSLSLLRFRSTAVL
jgi:hypothetical protein